MKNPLNSLKSRILYPLIPDPIQNKSDYNRRMISLIIGIVCLVGGLIVGIVVPKDSILQIWVYWGMVCALPFIPKIFKTIFRVGKNSYKAGKTLTEREYVEINHVGGNQYRARHRKENDGDFFALVGGFFAFLIVMIWYEIAGPILLGFKTYKTAKLITEYKNAPAKISDENIDNEHTAI